MGYIVTIRSQAAAKSYKMKLNEVTLRKICATVRYKGTIMKYKALNYENYSQCDKGNIVRNKIIITSNKAIL